MSTVRLEPNGKGGWRLTQKPEDGHPIQGSSNGNGSPCLVNGDRGFFIGGKKVRTILLKQIGLLQLEEVPEPIPAPGLTLLRVSRCALCRSDAKMWAHGHRDLALPRVLGHEICGTLERSGDRFVVWPGESCGQCLHCSRMAENLCTDMKILGFNRDGGLAEKVLVAESSLIGVPAGLSDEVACLAEPMGCAFNALEQAQTRAGDAVLILGGGPVGLLMALAAKSLGASPLVVDTSAEKLLKSEAFRTRLEIRACSGCENGLFDVAVNACPSVDALAKGISLLKSGGCFCLFSGLPGDIEFSVKSLNEIHYRQLRLVGAYGCTRAQMAQAMTVLNEFQAEARLLIEEEIPLHRTAEGLRKVISGKSLKIVVNPGA